MDNRTKILNIALELFALRGYDATGIKEITQKAAITKPTLYHYFGNKQGLLKTILELHFKKLDQTIETAARYNGDLTGSLKTIAEAYFLFFQHNPLFYRMQLGMAFAPPESEAAQTIATLYINQYRILETMFQQAVVQHGNIKGRERLYAISFIGTINTYITAMLHGEFTPDDHMIYRILHQFEHGIYS